MFYIHIYSFIHKQSNWHVLQSCWIDMHIAFLHYMPARTNPRTHKTQLRQHKDRTRVPMDARIYKYVVDSARQHVHFCISVASSTHFHVDYAFWNFKYALLYDDIPDNTTYMTIYLTLYLTILRSYAALMLTPPILIQGEHTHYFVKCCQPCCVLPPCHVTEQAP